MNFLNKQKKFYKGKKIFITGHTGFKGAWLTAMLSALEANVLGYALRAEEKSLFEKIHGREMLHHIEGDVRDFLSLKSALLEFQPEIVIHLAANASVNDCHMNPQMSYDVNIMGTVNILESIRYCQKVKSVLIVTTDKVYRNIGDGKIYKEDDELYGADVYSSSKVCMEYITEIYKNEYLYKENKGIGISTVRASNVLGGGDHIKSRLIPSILEACAQNSTIQLRNPYQTRPWQNVLDALDGYLTICRMMHDDPEKYSGQWNIGPYPEGIKSVEYIVQCITNTYFTNAKWCESSGYGVKESETLGLDITKSLNYLEWIPRKSLEDTLYDLTMFYKAQVEGKSEKDYLLRLVHKYYRIEG